MSQCHHAVTRNLAKLTEQLFVAGAMAPGLASNCSTFELLDVRNADPFLHGGRGETGIGRRGALAALWPNDLHRQRAIHKRAARLQGAVCKPLFMPVNHLLTITPQHRLNRVATGHGPKAQLIVHLGGEPRLAGLQGVTSCRHLAYEATSACFPNSSWRFSARLAWVSRLRLQSSGFVPDRHPLVL